MTTTELTEMAELAVDDPRYVGWQVDFARAILEFDEEQGRSLKPTSSRGAEDRMNPEDARRQWYTEMAALFRPANGIHLDDYLDPAASARIAAHFWRLALGDDNVRIQRESNYLPIEQHDGAADGRMGQNEHKQNCPALIFDGDYKPTTDEGKCLCGKGNATAAMTEQELAAWAAAQRLMFPKGSLPGDRARAIQALLADRDEREAHRLSLATRLEAAIADRDALKAQLGKVTADQEKLLEAWGKW